MPLDLPPPTKPLLETITEVESFESRPFNEQFPHNNSYQMLSLSAVKFADDPAMEFLLTGKKNETPVTISFNELGKKITQTANLLNNLGLRTTQAVSIVLPILPQTHYAIWGAQAAGIANPINPLLDADHIGEIIQAAGSEVVICLAPSEHSDIWNKVTTALTHANKIHTILAVTVPGLTSTQALPDSIDQIKVADFNDAINTQSADHLYSRRVFNGDEIAAFFHTGGTTGRPKIAQLTHANMAYLGQLMQFYTAHMERHTILCGLPLFHIYGVIIQGVAAFSVGYRIVLMTPSGFRSPEAMKNFWHHIARFKVKGFSTVPTVLMALSQIPIDDEDISCLTNINSGAAPLSNPFKLGFEKKFNVAVANGYGMTETTALISRAPENQPPGSVGMRIPFSRIRIVHLDSLKVTHECKLGESGIILVKGPQVFRGYKHESDNRDAWIEDGWFNTGDLGYLDANGFLYLSGRAKDLIIRSGHNIDPVIIEEPLSAHPGVNNAIAVGMPDRYAGELPMAYVVLNPGSEVTPTELSQYCENHISERAAIPKRFEIVDAMPLTAVGKVYKPRLRQLITEKILAELLAAHQIDATVTTQIDKQKGLVASVTLKNQQDDERVRELLQSFAIEIEINHTEKSVAIDKTGLQ